MSRLLSGYFWETAFESRKDTDTAVLYIYASTPHSLPPDRLTESLLDVEDPMSDPMLHVQHQVARNHTSGSYRSRSPSGSYHTDPALLHQSPDCVRFPYLELAPASPKWPF